MRHLPRLNRVACGILGRWHPSVLTLLAQKTADFRQDLERRAPRVIYCASGRYHCAPLQIFLETRDALLAVERAQVA
jgi:hypothetical protein